MIYINIAVILITGYVLFHLRRETHDNQSLMIESIKENRNLQNRIHFHNRIFTGQRYRGLNYIINRHILTIVEIQSISTIWKTDPSIQQAQAHDAYLLILEVYVNSLQAICHTLSILCDYPEDDEAKRVDMCIMDDLKKLDSCLPFEQIMATGGVDQNHEIYHRAKHFSELLHTLKDNACE